MSISTFHIICLAFLCSVIAAEKCKVSIGSSKTFNMYPLYYKKSGELYDAMMNVNNGIEIEIADKEEVVVSCGINRFKNLGNKVNAVKVVCDAANGYFKIPEYNEEKAANKLGCDLRVIEEMLEEVKGCPSIYNSSSIVYQDNFEQKQHVLGEVCLSVQEGRTVFAHIKMNKDGK